MGSNQSNATTVPAPEAIMPASSRIAEKDQSDNQQEQPSLRNRSKELSGLALVEYKCRKKKKAWSTCVGSFYGRFSSGKALEDEEADCDDLFEQYRSCYLKGLLKDRQRKGLDPPQEGTMLAEFAKDEGLEWQKKT